LSKLKGIIEDLLVSGYDVRISTRGLSMCPFIKTGDKITISPEKNITIGDIIVFKRNNGMVCHRVIKVCEKGRGKYYQTRGDGLFIPDEPLLSSQILGKVLKIEREEMSFTRRILLLIYPALRSGTSNARVISALVRLKRIFQLTSSRRTQPN